MYFVLSASAILALRGHLRLADSGPWIAGGFALLYLTLPFRLFDTTFADVRIIPAAGLVLPAFANLTIPNAAWRRALASAAAAFALANLILVGFVWTSYRPEYAAMIASFDRIAKGSAVLVAHSGDGQDPPQDRWEYPIFHAPTLAVAYADALVPTIFTYPGKQPLTVRPAYRRLTVPQGGPAPIAILQAIVSGAYENPPAYIRSWSSDFDYLYVVGPRAPNPMPSLLNELAAGSRFALYRIDKTAHAGDAR